MASYPCILCIASRADLTSFCAGKRATTYPITRKNRSGIFLAIYLKLHEANGIAELGVEFGAYESPGPLIGYTRCWNRVNCHFFFFITIPVEDSCHLSLRLMGLQVGDEQRGAGSR